MTSTFFDKIIKEPRMLKNYISGLLYVRSGHCLVNTLTYLNHSTKCVQCPFDCGIYHCFVFTLDGVE